MSASVLANPLSAGNVKAALEGASNELAYLFDAFKIPVGVQAMIVSQGYSDVEVWSKLEDTFEGVRGAIKSDLGIDAARGGIHRGVVARLRVCWETEQKRSEATKRDEAEIHVAGMPRLLRSSEHLELRRAYAAAFRPLADRACPAPTLVEGQLDQLEEGELQPEALKDVISRELASG